MGEICRYLLSDAAPFFVRLVVRDHLGLAVGKIGSNIYSKGGDDMTNGETGNNQGPSWAIVILLIGIIPVGLLSSRWIGLGWNWAIIAVLMLLAIGVTGLSLGKGWVGVLIDPATNTMSLSRLQVMLWTWVILSSFVTLALGRISAKCAEPLAIQLPPLLWALMGISMTSAVGSPLLKAAKAQKTAGQEEVNQQRAIKRGVDPKMAATYRTVLAERKSEDERLREQVGETKPLGAIVRKDSWQKAVFSDIFTGEEVATFGYLDIAKVQNVFFTVVAVVGYTVALVAAMSGTQNVADLFAFPDMPAGLVAIIGISHGGYLIDKAVTHSTPAEEKPPVI